FALGDYEKQEVGMDKDYYIEVGIMYKDRKEWNNGQNGCGKISYEGEFLQFMGIKPQHKNIGRKEKHSLKVYITGKNHRQKIKDEVGRELGALTYQSIKHGFSQTVDQILFTAGKTVYDITPNNGRGRSKDQH